MIKTIGGFYMSKKHSNFFAATLSLAMMLIGSIIVLYLNIMTTKNQEIINNNHISNQNNETRSVEPTGNKIGAVITNQNNQPSLTEALAEYDPKKTSSIETIDKINKQHFQDKLIDSQDEILAAINKNNLDVEDLGYLFLPDQPSHYPEISDIKQIDIPLILQKDAKWRSIPYGNTTTRQLGENGCAIVSLAMVHSALSKSEKTPQDILDWSKQHYYVANQGTSWEIFHEFAQEFNYQFYNFGNDFYTAMQAVQDGDIIIASVNPGYFTETGHILVIRGYQDGRVYVNDPNDDPLKMFSIQGIDEDIFLTEGVNYWSFSKQ